MNCEYYKNFREMSYRHLEREVAMRAGRDYYSCNFLACDGDFHWILVGDEYRGARHTYKFTEVRIGICPQSHSEKISGQIQAAVGDEVFEAADQEFNLFSEHVKHAVSWMNGIDKKHLLVTGASGVGKTRLMKGLQADTIGHGNRVKFWKSEDLRKIIIRANMIYDGIDAEAKTELLETKAFDLVIIDDLGTEQKTESDAFVVWFCDFLDSKTGKLAITSNLNLQAINTRYGDRIYSRILDGSQLIEIKGRDYRRTTCN